MAISPVAVCVGGPLHCDWRTAFSGLCHCRNCQRYTGSAFEALRVPSRVCQRARRTEDYDDTGDSAVSALTERLASPERSPLIRHCPA